MRKSHQFNVIRIFGPLLGAGISLSLSASSAFATTGYSCPPGIGADATSILDTTCYAYYKATKPWNQAKAACASFGGSLAVIHDSTVQSTVHALQLDSAWVGAGDNNDNVVGSTEGDFFWLGDTEAFWIGGQFGDPVGYTNWEFLEPNNLGGENCMEMYAHGNWNDLNCAASLPYICQFGVQMSSSNSSADTQSHDEVGGGLRPELLKERQDQAAAKYRAMAHSSSPSVASSSTPAVAATPSLKASVVSPKAVAAASSSKFSVASKSSVASSIPDASMIRIVVTPTLNFRADARIDAYVKRVLKRGQTTRLLAIVDKDWAYVLLPDGDKGYVWRKHLTK